MHWCDDCDGHHFEGDSHFPDWLVKFVDDGDPKEQFSVKAWSREEAALRVVQEYCEDDDVYATLFREGHLVEVSDPVGATPSHRFRVTGQQTIEYRAAPVE